MKNKQLFRALAVVLLVLSGGIQTAMAYYSSWNYSATAKDNGQESDGGNYTFRYDKADTKEKFMDFRTYYLFDVNKGRFLWNWDVKVNYGTVDDKNTTHLTVTIEFADGTRTDIAQADFVGYNAPMVSWTNRPMYFIRVQDKCDFKYMLTVEYQPTAEDLQRGVRRVYICGKTEWNQGKDYHYFQYERDLDISSYRNMMPEFGVELDDNGNFLFSVNKATVAENIKKCLDQYYEADVCYGNSIYQKERVKFTLNRDTKTGGTDNEASFTFTVPVKSYTVPLRFSKIDYTLDIMRQTQVYRGSDHYAYTVGAGSGNDYKMGLVIQPYTRVEKLTVEFDKWKKQNIIQWTRNKEITEKIDYYTSETTECLTEGTWYVLRYDKGQSPADYTLIKEIKGSSNNLKAEDSNIDYDKEYVYRVVFLPTFLKDKFEDKLTNLPGESDTHTEYDLWEESAVKTTMELPIRMSQDRTDLNGVRLTWDYNVQKSGCEWRIYKHKLGENTWTPVATLPIDSKQSTASYLEEGGSVCDQYVYRIATTINDKELFSDTLVCNLPSGAYISDVQASTGTEEKTVIVKWKVTRPGDDEIVYSVLRRPVGSADWVVLTNDIHGNAKEYTYIDDRVMAGSYYEYSIEAFGAKCNEQLVKTDSKVVPGFSQARGTITGHIAYGTGTAVTNARVNLIKSSADESTDQAQFFSRYIDGVGKGLQWRADSANYAKLLNGKKALTLQLWAKPSLASQTDDSYQNCTLLQLADALAIGVTSDDGFNYHLWAMDKSNGGAKITDFPSLVFDPFDFTHISAVYQQGRWTFYVGNDSLLTATLPVADTNWNACKTSSDERPTLSIGGDIGIGNLYTGYVDDIRLWNRALSEKEITENYTRILGGIESGLELYWPLDEGMNVHRYAFDVSCQDGLYKLNHPEVGLNTTITATVPEKLGLYGTTDSEGDYIIRGIPFQQGGTNYKLSPQMGIHEFKPNTRSMFISPTSLTANNIDFEDVSSFPMSGHIYYAGTNIPAVGVLFYVDGELLTGDGQVKQTDADGYYQISVPIGRHYVEAKLEKHNFVGGGRFPLTGTYNFDRAVQYDFADSTLVNFVGRVSGGERNDTLAVGFGLSNNNIGMATIKLKLNSDAFSFNCQDDHISDATRPRYWQSDTASIESHSWTGTGYDSKYIFIRTDSLTGEFSAMLPPLKYITQSVTVDSIPDIEFGSTPEIDLTNVLVTRKDSVLLPQSAEGDSLMHTYEYHTKQRWVYYAKPQVQMWQTDNSEGAFGLKEYEGEDSFGTYTIGNIWTRDNDGNISYTYNYPVFQSGQKTTVRLRGFEVYENRDAGFTVADTLPLSKQVITINNEMSNEQKILLIPDDTLSHRAGEIVDLKSNQLELNRDGYATFYWTTGAPSVTAPHTRQLNSFFERNGRTYNGPQLNGVVLGSLSSGKNFVTQGPDHVMMILRDPPGAKSKTSWTSGTTKTKVKVSSHSFYGDEKITMEVNLGLRLHYLSGFGVYMDITDVDNTIDLTEGVHYKVQNGWNQEQTWSLTTTQTISTGGAHPYVSSNGDVFIGVSTNMLLGECRKVGFFRDNKEADFELKIDDALSVGDSVTTSFMYSAFEIENVMMPKWRDTRNSYITVFFNTKDEAKAFKNTGNEVLYVTWLDKDDPNFAKDTTTYVIAVPESWDWKKNPVVEDKVQWCNIQIENWRKQLEDNEADKVKAIKKQSDYWQRNISFDGGSSYSYSSRHDTTDVTKHTYTHNLGYIGKIGTTAKNTAAAIQYKNKFIVDTENGWAMTDTDSDYDENTKDYAQFTYSFEDGNESTDFSVDIYKSPAGWSDIFSLFGGQSYNPYEGEEVTRFFEPGQHVISNGTQRMEQPEIRISTDGVIGAKTATLTDVPAGQLGQFTLHLSNNGTTHQAKDFTFKLMVQEMADTLGLEILMDGVPANGRSIFIPHGETVKKIITVRQTDQSILDYEGLELWFCSSYQSIKIHDAISFNVHFKPSSSPIDLVISDPVINTENKDGKLSVKLTNFDRQFRNLKNVGLQYRYEGNRQWTTLHTYVTDRKDSLSKSFSMLPPTGDIRLTADMSSATNYPEGTYYFRAFTTTPYGKEDVMVYSDEIKVVKDMTRPRNLTTPAPANGILRYGDDLMVEFNEDIVPGYVSDKNIIVTAKLNNQPVAHDVAVHISRRGGGAYSENPIFLNGDFSTDFWMNRETEGTLLQLGIASDLFALRFYQGHAELNIAGAKIVSEKTVPTDEWVYYVLSYRSSDQTISMLAEYGSESVHLFENQKLDIKTSNIVNYIDDNRLYLGPISASIHDLSFFSIYRDVNEAAATKYMTKDNYVYGLANYWPMNEGHGSIATDTRHTNNIILEDNWVISNTNYMAFNHSGKAFEADISQINTGQGDSYAIEMWYAVSDIHPDTITTVFETGTKPSNRLHLYFDKQMDLVLDYGTKSQVVAKVEDFPYNDQISHYALNVVRGQSAGFYVNGQRTAVIAETDVPPMEGTVMKIGEDAEAYIDEVRIWEATLTEEQLLSNMYNTIDTADYYSRGLVAYYPFEEPGVVNGVSTMVPSVRNMANSRQGSNMPDSVIRVSDNYELVGSDAPLKNAPVESRITARPIASDRKLTIKLEEGSGIKARDVEGTTLNITIDKIRDLNGNESAPIRWQTFVQLNTLKWLKDSVNISKKYGSDCTFDVGIENRSGNTEYYTLQNMPEWLTLVDSERNDDIDPLKQKTLRFKVNPLIPVGRYDVSIGLKGNNEILEPLRIVMKVNGEMPQWSVNPSDYENNMNIVGQIYINGILMGNSDCRLAAFIGDECRGVAAPKQIRGAAYVPLTVYGTAYQMINGQVADLDNGMPLTFRIWDASNGMIYSNVRLKLPEDDAERQLLLFDPTQSFGDFSNPVIFTKSDQVEQPLALRKGWNWLSLGVEPAAAATSLVFKDLNSWSAQLKDKTSGVSYCRNNIWTGSLKEVHANTMYKLQLIPTAKTTETSQTLNISGAQVKLSETPVIVKKDWNWIAYTPLTTQMLDEALAGANPQEGDQIKSQTAFAYYGPFGWEGNLEALESGKGYLYFSTDTQTKQFVYPTVTDSRTYKPRRANRASESSFPTVDPTAYPDNMAIVIRLTDGSEAVTTAEVAAFIDGECRGSAFADDDLYYLLVAGEGSGQPIEIRICIDGTFLTMTNTLTYVSDGSLGTPWEPYVISLSELTGISDLNADQLPDVWYTLQGICYGTVKPTTPGVYIYNGQKVVIK
ncbi:MAG: laminin G domain-containing protein [Bacteroidales bacterium]|nr:laminin G domain-containing protein [Bacteroidales bacterium]